MEAEGPWSIKTKLNLDASFDIPTMLSDSGKLSLSDIVAATIGASDAGCDTKSGIPLVPDMTENSVSHDSNSQLGGFYSLQNVKKENSILQNGISGLLNENSNACDSFSTKFSSREKIHDTTKESFCDGSGSGKTLQFPDFKEEAKYDCQVKMTSTKGIISEDKYDVDDEFFTFLGKITVDQTVRDSEQTDQQVVPKSENQSLQSYLVVSHQSETADPGTNDGDQSTASFDSDLEDSIQFVDPDHNEEEEFCEKKTDANQSSYEPYDDGSCPKRFRSSEFDNNTCPLPYITKQENLDACDFMSENSMPSDLNKSFSTKFVTPANSRSRSLSEACNRDESSPLGESRFNVSLSSLLGSPLTDSPLSNNPFFSDLKSILEKDCKKTDYPVKLFDTLSNKQNQDVYSRERNLQAKFSSLQSRYPEEVRKLSSFYRCQSAEVETERFRQLHGENIPVSYRNYLNDFYDDQLHKIMNRVEKSVKVLSEAKQEITHINRVYLRSRPLLSRKAVSMMEEWYTRNFEHPYPSQSAVDALAKAGEISMEQVKKWFANKRNRCKNTKPQPEIANMKRKRQYSSRW